MKKTLVVALIALAGCQSVGQTLPVGVDTYKVSSESSKLFASWSDVKDLSIKRANDFCDGMKKTMTVVSWETHGVRGWTSLNAELTFKCA